METTAERNEGEDRTCYKPPQVDRGTEITEIRVSRWESIWIWETAELMLAGTTEATLKENIQQRRV